jgi:hypothetical protein
MPTVSAIVLGYKNEEWLSERNRLMFVSTVWGRRALVLLFPPLVALEVAMALFAAKNGWFRDKVRGWRWLWQHRAHLAARRRELRAERTVPDREWMKRLDSRVESPLMPVPGFVRAPLNLLTVAYWALARRLL